MYVSEYFLNVTEGYIEIWEKSSEGRDTRKTVYIFCISKLKKIRINY